MDSTIGLDDEVEFTTRIRDRVVRCSWTNGRLSGDEELLRRIERSGRRPEELADAVEAMQAVVAAVAHRVTVTLQPG